MTTSIPTAAWRRFTVFNGFAAMASYTAAAFASLPERISLLLAFAFGPFFMLASLGLYRLGRAWKDSIALQAGALFNLAGTALVTLMLVVQQTSFAFHRQFRAADRGTVTEEQLKWIFKEVNAVQLGIDLAWDVFISAGTFLLALGLLRHPAFRTALPLLGMLVAILLLGFNMASFPVPPDEAGSIDFGPMVAAWYTLMTGAVAVQKRRFTDSMSPGAPDL